MNIRFWERVLIALCGLLTLALGIVLFVYGVGLLPYQLDLSVLNVPLLWQRIVILAVALIVALIGMFGVCILFRRRKDKGFIIQNTEFGDMSISLHALENMVKKCVESHKELSAGSTRISRLRDGIGVHLKVTLSGGANIPLTVNALQKQIKQYITSSSGVDVKEVQVMVETNANKMEAPKPVEEEPAAEPEATHADSVASILSHKEEPAQYAVQDTPAETEAPAEAAPVSYDEPSEADEPTAEGDGEASTEEEKAENSWEANE